MKACPRLKCLGDDFLGIRWLSTVFCEMTLDVAPLSIKATISALLYLMGIFILGAVRYGEEDSTSDSLSAATTKTLPCSILIGDLGLGDSNGLELVFLGQSLAMCPGWRQRKQAPLMLSSSRSESVSLLSFVAFLIGEDGARVLARVGVEGVDAVWVVWRRFSDFHCWLISVTGRGTG